jgi:uncharacterized phage protein (TIGR02218 family)
MTNPEPVPPWLEAELIPLAWCWRIERRDGAILGFTTHDNDLLREGLLYRAAPGMDPSAIRLSNQLDGDTMSVAGALTHAAISAQELAAGRYDGARITISVINWADASIPPVTMATGQLMGISHRQGGFTAEVSLRHSTLDTAVSIATSPTCRARLGDAACRVDMERFRQQVRILSVSSETSANMALTISEPLGTAINGVGLYHFGELRWLDGAMAGISTSILAQDGQNITLAERPAIAPQPGWRVELTQGCDKRIETCRTRFANATHFQGEPYLPGMDLLTRYPGG